MALVRLSHPHAPDRTKVFNPSLGQQESHFDPVKNVNNHVMCGDDVKTLKSFVLIRVLTFILLFIPEIV